METLFSIFRTNFWTRWVGGKEQPLTSMLSGTGSCCAKSSQVILQKLAQLAEENSRLKEELRLYDLKENLEYDL